MFLKRAQKRVSIKQGLKRIQAARNFCYGQNITKALQIAILVFFLAGCSDDGASSKRIQGLPKDAVWVCGVDGGTWIDCVSNEEKYKCEIYNDSTGELLVTGTYLLRKITFDETKNMPIYEKTEHREIDIRYQMWDGDIIHLAYGFALVPHGEIAFPSDGSHGKKQLYEFGIPIGEEKDY